MVGSEGIEPWARMRFSFYGEASSSFFAGRMSSMCSMREENGSTVTKARDLALAVEKQECYEKILNLPNRRKQFSL